MKNFQEFIGSFSFDRRLAACDIEGSIAHVRMLAKCRIIPAADAKKIIKGLSSIAADLQKGRALRPGEDIHYAVEKELMRRIGPVGGKMHTARSRNDQVALDLRLYLRSEINQVLALLARTQQAIVAQAEKNAEAVMPGYTHLQPAQPVLFAHHLLAYAWMFERDKERFRDCLKRVNVLPLGSAALAGTSFPIDRKYVARLLGFAKISENSMDAVSDRDFAVEFLSSAAVTGLHLSRLAEELIVWSSAEFGFVRLADEFTSGSSIMPQKRNPDTAELVRGKTGRLYGDLVALLTLMKALPLAYNRDMQEDKPPVFDAADTLGECLEVAAGMLKGMKIHAAAMLKATERGFLSATELADYLSRKGVPFRLAHGTVKEVVAHCIARGKTLDELTPGELQRFDPRFGADLRAEIHPGRIVRKKTSQGGTSPRSVRAQIRSLSRLMNQM
ncbi:MAG: argininosuccinate lyase [Endomicrobiales bacterium]